MKSGRFDYEAIPVLASFTPLKFKFWEITVIFELENGANLLAQIEDAKFTSSVELVGEVTLSVASVVFEASDFEEVPASASASVSFRFFG